MAETKYGKHLIKAPIQTAKAGPPIPTMYFPPALNGIGVGMILVPVLKPRLFEDPPISMISINSCAFSGATRRISGSLELISR